LKRWIGKRIGLDNTVPGVDLDQFSTKTKKTRLKLTLPCEIQRRKRKRQPQAKEMHLGVLQRRDKTAAIFFLC